MTFLSAASPSLAAGNPTRMQPHEDAGETFIPWGQFPIETVTTLIAPGFKTVRWVGHKGVISEVTFKPSACRTQITVRQECSDELLADNLVGFHWLLRFGDYRKEIGYALRRVGIQWDNLDRTPTKTMN